MREQDRGFLSCFLFKGETKLFDFLPTILKLIGYRVCSHNCKLKTNKKIVLAPVHLNLFLDIPLQVSHIPHCDAPLSLLCSLSDVSILNKSTRRYFIFRSMTFLLMGVPTAAPKQQGSGSDPQRRSKTWRVGPMNTPNDPKRPFVGSLT